MIDKPLAQIIELVTGTKNKKGYTLLFVLNICLAGSLESGKRFFVLHAIHLYSRILSGTTAPSGY